MRRWLVFFPFLFMTVYRAMQAAYVRVNLSLPDWVKNTFINNSSDNFWACGWHFVGMIIIPVKPL